MALESEQTFNEDGTKAIYVFDSESPKDRHLTFLINDKEERIEFYPREDFPVDMVELIAEHRGVRSQQLTRCRMPIFICTKTPG